MLVDKYFMIINRYINIIGIKVILTVSRREAKAYRIKMKYKQVVTREGDQKLYMRKVTQHKGKKNEKKH